MAIIGFNFTKISAEKRAPVHGKINVSNNVSIANVTDANLAVTPKKGLRVHFAYTSAFEPGLGSIQLEGDLLLLEDAKVAETLLAEWQKSKALPKELMPALLNAILERANVQALILARDLGLPSPVPMPKVNVQGAAPAKAADAKPAKKK